jgi:D-amino peptidase
MEGISGITGPEQTDPSKHVYERCLKLMIADANSAIEGAVLGGASEVLVNDSHWNMRNLPREELNPKAQLISGNSKRLSMMEGIDESFDLAIFVGYHARIGTAAAIMDHTYTTMVSNVWINDKLTGETGINAGLAGHFNVPVGAVTGDDKLVKEASSLLGNVETAVVKEAIDRYAARCRPLEETHELIRNAARKAVERKAEFKLLKHATPVKFTVGFVSTAEAAVVARLPFVKMEDARTISFVSEDYLIAYKNFLSTLALASTRRDEIFG